jgi:hypothetical protein
VSGDSGKAENAVDPDVTCGLSNLGNGHDQAEVRCTSTEPFGVLAAARLSGLLDNTRAPHRPGAAPTESLSTAVHQNYSQQVSAPVAGQRSPARAFQNRPLERRHIIDVDDKGSSQSLNLGSHKLEPLVSSSGVHP